MKMLGTGVRMRHDPAMPAAPSLLLANADRDQAVIAARMLTERGWSVTTVADGAAAIAAAAIGDFALIWLAGDLPLIATDRVAARLGERGGPSGVTPILILPADAPLPTEDGLHRLAVATGDARAPSCDPVSRLAPLFGRAGILRLLHRFRDRLAAILDAPDPYAIGEGDTPAALAHRLAGLAGTLDFPVLSTAWAAVEQAGTAHLADAWVETLIARAMLDMLLDREAVREA